MLDVVVKIEPLEKLIDLGLNFGTYCSNLVQLVQVGLVVVVVDGVDCREGAERVGEAFEEGLVGLIGEFVFQDQGGVGLERVKNLEVIQVIDVDVEALLLFDLRD